MIKKWARKEGHHLVINYKGSIMVSPIVIYCPDKVVYILIEIGLPEVITWITQMPSAETMDRILEEIKPGQ